MKKNSVVLFCSLLLSILMSLTVWAGPFNLNDYSSVNTPSDLLPKTVRSAYGYDSTKVRGNFFAEANVLDVPADEAYITIYLDRWDVAGERWRQVTYYDAEFYAKDYQEGLNRPSLNITFKNQDKGYYYRLRGAFVVVYDGEFEGYSPATDGVWVD